MQQPPPISPSRHPDDEISLLELWQILVKRWALVFLVFLGCILAGAAYAFFKPPVFEANATLRIGQIQSVLLESPQELIARLVELGSGAVSASVARGANNLVSVVSRSGSAEEAAAALEQAVASVIRVHEGFYQQSTEPLRERVAQIDVQRQAVERELNDIDQLVRQIRGKEPVQASLLVMQRSPLGQTAQQLDAERLRLLQQLSPPQARPTELLGQIAMPARPVQPRKWLILAVAAVLGLMGGVMLAFVAEFVANAKANKPPVEPASSGAQAHA
jgi:uncharacterized protein involved in exopolysaccharide biosynthesis